MLTFIDVTYSSARLGLFSSANILAIISLSFHYIISYHFAYFLILGRVKCSPFSVFTTKTTQPRPQVFSVNGALTCKESALLTSSVD